MDDTRTWDEGRAMSPADYTRLMDAAKRRANTLRREAGEQFWRQMAALVVQGLRRKRSAGSMTRTIKAQGVVSHRVEG